MKGRMEFSKKWEEAGWLSREGAAKELGMANGPNVCDLLIKAHVAHMVLPGESGKSTRYLFWHEHVADVAKKRERNRYDATPKTVEDRMAMVEIMLEQLMGEIRSAKQ